MGFLTAQADLTGLEKLALEATAKSGCVKAVEVGSWAGATALVLGKAFTQLFCVDTWEGSPADWVGGAAAKIGPRVAFQAFCRNMGDRLYRTVFPCAGRSQTYAAIWPFPVGLVFIDADHRYEHVKADILAWRPHVAKGGLLVGHDYGVFEGVTRAVKELVPEWQLNTGGEALWWQWIE
jgi:hypothetical protein